MISASFPAGYKEGDYKICLLYDTLKEKQHDRSKELIYRSIINNIDTAVLILEKKMTTGPFS
jgi:hypothetical protein